MISRTSITPVDHVWSADPDLDTKAEGFREAYKKHVKENAPASTLPVKPGGRLTVYRLRPLEESAWRRALRAEGADSDYEAVACSLVSVEGYELDKVPVTLKLEDDRVTPESLAKIYDPELFAELAFRVSQVSKLRPFRG